ncbi:glucokinase [Pseudarthrobacter sp. W1I19]|uniref:ROK family protein n=1 Tax=Pseudarthrobacter sp. W1I19 TaxID=3042288 RepID=UPI002787D4A0|nr:ROK family protein [Pseudarthrobacter sp. W1I19]MDQ0923888.1 glucokinase [Pseudarthrobacter sp. W1I19]
MTLHLDPGAEPGSAFPALEIGGTHVTAALVKAEPRWEVLSGTVKRLHLDAHGAVDDIVATLSEAAINLGDAHNNNWGVALPGPFDYESGIARYHDVRKFDQLRDHDLRNSLAQRLHPQTLAFLNDADAFGIGEYAIGTAGSHKRAVCLTLGTGIGSSFLDNGAPVKTGSSVPPDGSAYLLEHNGVPLEDHVSRRAIRTAYATATGINPAEDPSRIPDVREIAQAARTGHATASRVLHEAFSALGVALARYLESFEAETLIVGGSMAQSWDLVEPAIRSGIAKARPPLSELPLTQAKRAEEASLIGAANWTARTILQGGPAGN